MATLDELRLGFFSLPLLSRAKTRSISAENPQGEVGGGAKEEPEPDSPASLLGKGWKVRPAITLSPNSTTTLADIRNEGSIQHIWMTTREKAYRSCILRIFWDDETTPSVEVPLGDFFANGHALSYTVNSLPIVVNPVRGFNSYWPMPFRKSCKITLENQHWEDMRLFYQITYSLSKVPEEAAYFHAQWRRSQTTRAKPEHTILDGVQGKGHYVGTFLAWSQFSSGWWGEGEIKFFLDNDQEYPTICGTGTEDYFGGAWGFGGETYSTPFLGYPLSRKEPGEPPKHGLYRWHILDPIRFEKHLRVTIQALGWWLNKKYQPLTDDIASVAYWYQTEPHSQYPPFPSLEERWPR
jgi:hypothetical protein